MLWDGSELERTNGVLKSIGTVYNHIFSIILEIRLYPDTTFLNVM